LNANASFGDFGRTLLWQFNKPTRRNSSLRNKRLTVVGIANVKRNDAFARPAARHRPPRESRFRAAFCP
jgi:hypothetical protein